MSLCILHWYITSTSWRSFCCAQGDRGGDREAVEAARRAHQGLRPEGGRGQRAPPHRPPRDVEHPRLLGRRRQPQREHPHPAPGGRGWVRLLRGPASVVQLRPVLGHRDTRQDVHPRQVDCAVRDHGIVKPYNDMCRRSFTLMTLTVTDYWQ